MQREEFIQFYTNASLSKQERVFENVKNHFIRGDLLRFNEVYEDPLFPKEQMPRFTLSRQQNQFDTIMNLLDRNDGTSDEVWGLIRMLETNQSIYQQVLSMQVKDSEVSLEKEPEKFWSEFFSSGSIYKQSYKQEILEALMSDGSDLTNRVFFVAFQDPSYHYNEAVVPVVKQKAVNQSNQQLKENWTTKFLENGGLSYIISHFLSSELKQENDRFKL